MSYTTGGQTIDKSMNGIISFNGESVTADNITCETLEVNTSATFDGTATFNSNLPTSVITTTTNDNQFITRGIGNALYTGSGLLSSNNVWLGTNAFNTSVPTSILTGTPTSTQIAPVAMLDNIYGRLTTAFTNTWLSTNLFNAILPTSTLTGTPTSTQIAPVAMLNNLYVAIVAGGYARLTSVANAFTNNNSFNSFLPTSTITTSSSVNELINRTIANLYYGQITTGVTNTWASINVFNAVLPTSTLTGTPTTTQIAPVAMLDTLYAPKVTDGYARLTTVDNSFTNNNTFGGTTTNLNSTTTNIGGECNVISPTTTTSSTYALQIKNSETTPSFIKLRLNSVVSSPNVVAGDDVIYTNGILNLTTTSTSACNIRISTTDVAIQGTVTTAGGSTDINTTTNTMAGTTNNINGFNVFINPSSALQISAPTTNIIGTNVNVTSTGTLAIGAPTTTTFVNLPSTTTAFTTATANQFITKNIGDALYADEVTGGYARLTTVTNSFTNNNTFTGISNNFNTGVANQSANLGLVIRNNNSTGLINFVPCCTTGTFNPIVGFSDSVIASGPANNSGLVLTTNSTTRVGITIRSSGASGFVSTTAQETEVVGTATGATNIENFTIKNSETTPSSVKFLLNVSSSGFPNPMSIINDNTIYGSTGKRLVLTTVSATACGIGINATTVTVRGTDLNLTMTGTTTIAGTNCNINATSGTTIKHGQTASSLDIACAITNSIAGAGVRSCNFGLSLTGGNYNGIVSANDTAVIAGAASPGVACLVLTTHSNTAGGIRITSSGTNTITGITTFTNPIRFNYSATPTFVDYEIGYNIEPTGASIYAPTANQLYQGNSFTLTRGVWIVKSYCGIYSSINQARVYMSLSTSNLSHDVGNRTYAYSNAGAITVNGFQVNKVFVVPTGGTTLYVMLSSNLGTGINPTYFVSYQATRIA